MLAFCYSEAYRFIWAGSSS